MSLSDPAPAHIPPLPHIVQRTPLRTTAIVIYGTLLVLAVAIPQAPVNWLKGFEPSRLQTLLLDGALALQSWSSRLGIDAPFSTARRIFLDAAEKRED
jgi:hypothetical protein